MVMGEDLGAVLKEIEKDKQQNEQNQENSSATQNNNTSIISTNQPTNPLAWAVTPNYTPPGTTPLPYDPNNLNSGNQHGNANNNSNNSGNNNGGGDNNNQQSYTGEQSAVSEKMQDLASTISSVNKKFNNGKAVFTRYLLFKVNGKELVNTTSKNWDTNNLISFTHEINGSGQCNQFTLDIAFIPNDRNINDILTIEKILLDATAIINENGESIIGSNNGGTSTDSGDSDTNKNDVSYMYNCDFVYGYGDCDIRSPLYTGFITGYTPTLEDGWLRYTIKGVAGLHNAKELRLSSKKEYKENGGDTNPLIFLQNVFKIEFEKFKYNFVIADNVEKDVSCDLDYTVFQQKNLFDLVNDICNSMMSTEEANKTKGGYKYMPTQKQVYSYYVLSKKEGDNNGTVYLYKCPSLSKMSNDKDLAADCDIAFNWFAPAGSGSNFLVYSWKPEIDGAAIMAMMINYMTTGDVFETLDQDGNIVQTIGLGATRLGINNSSGGNSQGGEENSNAYITINSMQEYSKWSRVTQYNYNATLVTQGLPCEVPMTGKIKVRAMLGNFNQTHQSSGIYFVIGKKDIMNSSGFTTEFKLVKLNHSWDPDPVQLKTFVTTSGSIIKKETTEAGETTVTITDPQTGKTSELTDLSKEAPPNAFDVNNPKYTTGNNYAMNDDGTITVTPNYKHEDTFTDNTSNGNNSNNNSDNNTDTDNNLENN